jgi:hypothetical protein
MLKHVGAACSTRFNEFDLADIEFIRWEAHRRHVCGAAGADGGDVGDVLTLKTWQVFHICQARSDAVARRWSGNSIRQEKTCQVLR